MADHKQKDDKLAAETRPVPSQAEGERDPADAKKRTERPVPSQAEGERDETEEQKRPPKP